MSNSLRPHGLYSPRNFPGQNTGVGSLSLLQGIFPSQGSNPGLLHCRWILYQPSHKGSPRILEWVAYPFSRGSSWPRNRTEVSCISGRFTTSWTTGEAQQPQFSSVQFSSVTQSCLTLCDPMDYTVHGILQARTLELVALPFSKGSSQPRDQTQVCQIAGRFFTSWATREAQEYWSG